MNINHKDNFSGDILKERFGPIPTETGFKKRMRLHQGWWRTNVLNVPPGLHPLNKTEHICNTLLNGKETNNNFITDNTISTIVQTLKTRNDLSSGLIEEDRLYNNLLSSQPLCFNFFSELSVDKSFGLKVMKIYYPELTKLNAVLFEYAHQENHTKDSSAFDVAFEVEIDNKVGLIGWECKYTDSFSSTEYDKPVYRDLFSHSSSFIGSYDELKKSKTNQLFRNQLIAEGLLQNIKYEFVYTGLFCFQGDQKAIDTATDFGKLLNPMNTNFRIITYSEFIKNVQMLDIDWKLREWSMLLWARYCGTILSENTIKQL